MKNKVLLIDVDILPGIGEKALPITSHHPIGLLYLSSALKDAFPDIECKIFHTAVSNNSIEDIHSLISSFKPDLIGLRALSIARAHFGTIAHFLHDNYPLIPVIAGGPYSSSSYNEILKSGLIDLAVIGEGEETIVELMSHFRETGMLPSDILGTAVLKDGLVILNGRRPLIQNIDTLKFPDYNAINLNDYCKIKNHAFQDASQAAFILTSRGCPYDCFYCHQNFGKRIRRRSAENVVAEMREHLEKRGINEFVFLDDVFNMPSNEAKKLLTLIAGELPGVHLSFPNGLRADHLDDELLDLFEKAGTVEMALAIESVVPRLQKLMGKNLNIKRATAAIQKASQRFITRVFFIVGFPTETYDEAMQTIAFAESCEYVANPTLSVLRLYNNSKLFNILKPTAEQIEKIAQQEGKAIHLEMFGDMAFYGDFFPAEMVPLKSADLKELLYVWVRNVLMNPTRLQKSHEVISKYLNDDLILNFYRGVFNKPNFSSKDLKRLM